MSQTVMSGTVNGVNVERLGATVQAVQQNPDLARFQFRTKNEWVNGGHNRSTPERGRRHAMTCIHIPPHHRVRRGCSACLCRSQLGHRADGNARAAEEPC